jgi:hypothetical protein
MTLQQAAEGLAVLYAARALALFRAVDPPFEFNDFRLNFFHRIPNQKFVSRGQRHNRIGHGLDALDQIGVDHDGLIVKTP